MEYKEIIDKIISNVEKVIVGKRDKIELILSAMLAKGHVLIEDVPGTGKTMLARAIAISTGCTFKRIQCTPDLLPSDILGVSVYNPETKKFEFRKGPIMSQIVLVDEINRATPKTQSALLEAMAETQITVEGYSIPLPRPFLVLATQNPIEFEGTFPLPEAQMDRFFISISIGYLTKEQEIEVVIMQKETHPIETLKPVSNPQEIIALQDMVPKVYVEDSIRDYIIELVNATRREPNLALGASPRASIALYKGAQALALIKGRDFVIPEDVKALVIPVLRHRIILKPEAKLRGYTPESIIEKIMKSVEVPISEKPETPKK